MLFKFEVDGNAKHRVDNNYGMDMSLTLDDFLRF